MYLCSGYMVISSISDGPCVGLVPRYCFIIVDVCPAIYDV